MKHYLQTCAAALLTLSVLSLPVQGQRIYDGSSLVDTLSFPGKSCRGMAITSDDATLWASAHPDSVQAVDVANLTSSSHAVPSWAVSSIALTSDDTRLFVPGRENSLLTMLSTDTGLPVWSISMPWPQSVVIDGGAQFGYTANVPYPNHHIRVVDLASANVVTTIDTGWQSYPDALALTEDGEYLFVVEAWGGSMSPGMEEVSIISTATRMVVKTIPLHYDQPAGIAIHQGVAYVCSIANAKVIMIDVESQTVSGEFPVAPGQSANKIHITAENHAFITDGVGQNVIVVDLQDGYQVMDVIPVAPLAAGHVVLTSNGERMFISDGYGRVGVYDLHYVLPSTVEYRPRTFDRQRTTGSIGAWLALPEGVSAGDLVDESVCITQIDGTALDPVVYASRAIPAPDGLNGEVCIYRFDAADLFPQIPEPGETELTLEGRLVDGARIEATGTARAR